MPIVLMCHMSYFNSALHFTGMSEATFINFFKLENFCLLYIASTLPRNTDRFDVLHAFLNTTLKLHGHVRGHQLLGLGQLNQVDNLLKYLLQTSEGLLLLLVSQRCT